MTRISELLEEAAKALDDGQDPLAHPFLSANEVTLDECFEMAEEIATAIRVWLGVGDLLMLMAKGEKAAKESLAGAVMNLGLSHYKAGLGAVIMASTRYPREEQKEYE